MNTAVLIYDGLICEPKRLHKLPRELWGSPSQLIDGLLAKAFRLAKHEKAKMVVLGASEQASDQQVESVFEQVRAHLPEVGIDEPDEILKKFHIDTVSPDELEVLLQMVRQCVRTGINKLVLVASPAHSESCREWVDCIKAKGCTLDIEINESDV